MDNNNGVDVGGLVEILKPFMREILKTRRLAVENMDSRTVSINLGKILGGGATIEINFNNEEMAAKHEQH